VNLAVSLHAPDNALRDYLVPLNKRYPIEELMQACRDYIDRTGRRVSFEYALMDGINDSPEHARALANLVKGMLCHVNLIPLNATDDPTFRAPTMAAVEAFQRELTAAGIPCTVRVERGAEIDAACGQLRAHAERRALGRRQMIPLPVQNNAALV
jgi:23S rRNA (adenine2503-C2)-methyltransferase